MLRLAHQATALVNKLEMTDIEFMFAFQVSKADAIYHLSCNMSINNEWIRNQTKEEIFTLVKLRLNHYKHQKKVIEDLLKEL